MANPLLQGASDRPVPIESVSDVNTKFDSIRDNINTLWKKTSDIKGIKEELVRLSTAIDSILVSISSPSLTLVDVILYLRSKNIDFDEIPAPTRDSDNNITQTLYKRGGSTVVTEVRAYTKYGHISTQTLTGEVEATWTHSYKSNNSVWNGVTRT